MADLAAWSNLQYRTRAIAPDQTSRTCRRATLMRMVGRALADFWSPVSASRPHDPGATTRFLPHALELGIDDGWAWSPSTRRDIAAASTDPAPGLDGLEYSFGRMPRTIGDVVRMAQSGVDRLENMHCSRTMFTPKADLVARGKPQRAMAPVQRPLMLMNSSEKHLVLAADRELAPAAAQAIAGPQCGFVQRRRIEEYVLGPDGCLTAYSIDSTSRAAALLLDFANACPSLCACHGAS